MILRRLALVLLMLFLTGVVAPTASELSWSVFAGDHVSHTEGAPCPDPDDRGYPCGPGCACTCCHARTVAPPVVPQQLSLVPPFLQEVDFSAYRVLHPQEVHLRVFRPPRA